MKTLYLSAGHSLADPGAVAPDGTKEADLAVQFRNTVAFYLTSANVPFALDAKGKGNLPLAKAVAAAKNFGIAVEFHCNSSTNQKATGVEALSATKDKALSTKLCAALSKVLDLPDRGAKSEDAGQHARLAFVQAGGIILELFFLSSDVDLEKYRKRYWMAAKAVAQVLIDEVRST